MRRLYRWAFNFTVAVSAVLFVAACVLWARKDTYIEGLEVTTPGGANIAICSFRGLTISVTGNWPERRGARYFGYPGDDPGSMRPQSLYLVLGGHITSTITFPGGCLQGGTCNCLVDSHGMILRGPPFPENPASGPRSPSLPCWGLRANHWMFAAAFCILPLSIALGFIRKRVRDLLRQRGGKCPSCGYDLCATPDRCPECGAVPKAKGAT
jgi:hypothetical protein